MGNLFANSESCIDLSIEGTELALLGEHIEDSFRLRASDALFSIEVRELQRAIGDVIILDAALIIFFD